MMNILLALLCLQAAPAPVKDWLDKQHPNHRPAVLMTTGIKNPLGILKGVEIYASAPVVCKRCGNDQVLLAWEPETKKLTELKDCDEMAALLKRAAIKEEPGAQVWALDALLGMRYAGGHAGPRREPSTDWTLLDPKPEGKRGADGSWAFSREYNFNHHFFDVRWSFDAVGALTEFKRTDTGRMCR